MIITPLKSELLLRVEKSKEGVYDLQCLRRCAANNTHIY
jgi:hypothetical protein